MKTLQEQLKECYPNVELNDRFYMRLQQFTAEDMIEFAIVIQQEQQKLIAEKTKELIYSDEVGEIFIDDYNKIQSSILNENNIIR